MSCYDGDQVIVEYDGSGSRLRRFVYGAGIDEPLVYYDIHFTRYYYHYDGLGSVAYSYDDNGNLANDGFYKYYYDCENRLTDVNYAANDNCVASYKYDWLGRRVIKTIHDTQTTIHYCYDGDQVIAEYDGSGSRLRRFVYGAGIDEPLVYYDIHFTRYYYHYDGLGSVVAISDSDGVVEQCSYDVFGAPSCVSEIGNPYKFTGRRYDDETGLYYYRARYYSSELGRFLQPDPIYMHFIRIITENPIEGHYAGISVTPNMLKESIKKDSTIRWLTQTLGGRFILYKYHVILWDENLYAYCINSPTNWIDSMGLFGGYSPFGAGGPGPVIGGDSGNDLSDHNKPGGHGVTGGELASAVVWGGGGAAVLVIGGATTPVVIAGGIITGLTALIAEEIQDYLDGPDEECGK